MRTSENSRRKIPNIGENPWTSWEKSSSSSSSTIHILSNLTKLLNMSHWYLVYHGLPIKSGGSFHSSNMFQQPDSNRSPPSRHPSVPPAPRTAPPPPWRWASPRGRCRRPSPAPPLGAAAPRRAGPAGRSGAWPCAGDTSGAAGRRSPGCFGTWKFWES